MEQPQHNTAPQRTGERRLGGGLDLSVPDCNQRQRDRPVWTMKTHTAATESDRRLVEMDVSQYLNCNQPQKDILAELSQHTQQRHSQREDTREWISLSPYHNTHNSDTVREKTRESGYLSVPNSNQRQRDRPVWTITTHTAAPESDRRLEEVDVVMPPVNAASDNQRQRNISPQPQQTIQCEQKTR